MLSHTNLLSIVCNDLFNHDSFAVIVWLLLATLLAVLFASIAYSHYRQVLDPNSSRAQVRSDQVRLDNLRYDHYGDQDDYEPQGYGRGQIPYPTFAPPPGPPPGFEGNTSSNIPPYEGNKLPGYGTDSRDDFGDIKEKPNAGDPFSDVWLCSLLFILFFFSVSMIYTSRM